MNQKILLRIDSLLKHIDEVLEDTNGINLTDLTQSRVLLKATCFSISQIGEQMNKLEESLVSNYPDLPWKRARGMRNFIVHDYDGIDVEQVYSTVINDLPKLKESFLTIKSDLLKTDN